MEVRFLGHVVLASGVLVDTEKVEAVMGWERLKSVFKVRNFFGLEGYYRRFIEDFSRLVWPMTKLTRKEVKQPLSLPLRYGTTTCMVSSSRCFKITKV